MQRDFAESLLRNAIIEAIAGDKGNARRHLERAFNHTALAERITGQNGILESPDSGAPKSGIPDRLKEILED